MMFYGRLGAPRTTHAVVTVRSSDGYWASQGGLCAWYAVGSTTYQTTRHYYHVPWYIVLSIHWEVLARDYD